MKSVNSSQDVFKKVHLSERKAIFRKIADVQSELLVKTEDDNYGQAKAIRLENDENLYCRVAAGALTFKPNSEVVVNFSWEEEKYFLRTTVNAIGAEIVLKVNVDIFQLQRRKNARLDVPEAFQAQAQILSVNGDPCHFESQLKDMSAGGCKVVFPQASPALKMGDQLAMSLILGKRRPLQLACEVRYAAGDGKSQTLGLQFLNRDDYNENRLLVLMMDLQREFYLKFGGN